MMPACNFNYENNYKNIIINSLYNYENIKNNNNNLNSEVNLEQFLLISKMINSNLFGSNINNSGQIFGNRFNNINFNNQPQKFNFNFS